MADRYGEMPVFDKGKADLGIHEACAAFDRLELTLTERFFVVHCLDSALRGILGEKYDELARVMGVERGEDGAQEALKA